MYGLHLAEGSHMHSDVHIRVGIHGPMYVCKRSLHACRSSGCGRWERERNCLREEREGSAAVHAVEIGQTPRRSVRISLHRLLATPDRAPSATADGQGPASCLLGCPCLFLDGPLRSSIAAGGPCGPLP